MLEIIPTGLFSTDYGIFENGNILGVIYKKILSLKDKATFLLKEQKYSVSREGELSGHFLMLLHDTVIARAEKSGFLRDVFIIKYAEREFRLEGKFLSLRDKFFLFEGKKQIGSILQKSFFSRKMAFDIHADIPLEIKFFIIYLALVIKSRNSESAPAGGV